MGKIILYANGNGQNHGCEALSRSLCKLFADMQVVEYVREAGADQEYGVSQVAARKELQSGYAHESTIMQIWYKIAYKLHWHNAYNRIRYSCFLNEINSDDIALSIGGDNYCYSDITWLQSLNTLINKKTQTVLLGVSIESKLLKSVDLCNDLNQYALIIARESLTYDALVEHGLDDKTVLIPDSAFLLEKEATELPPNFAEGNTVGINISPMIMGYEENQGMAYQNYEELVRYILENTDMSVALIPHVVWQMSDDRIPLQRLYDTFGDSGRVCLIEDQNCMRLKYIISKCRFFVGARTHATIAAYSTCVPTLVVGYSVKAKGIAKDLFGTYENYVIPVQSLSEQNELTKAFEWLQTQEVNVRTHLEQIMPQYMSKVEKLPMVIRNIKESRIRR